MLPVDNTTTIDKALHPLLDAHPNQTGLVLLDSNLDAFTLRAITAKEAGRSLDLQYYIWNNDLTGNLLSYELLRAADRGVRIRLLLDDMNVSEDNVLATLEQHPNIEVRLYNPVYSRKSTLLKVSEMVYRGSRLNRRMHNKIWLADGRVSIVGGRNIGDEYFDAAKQTNFFDVDVLLLGDAVKDTQIIFDQFWNSIATVPLKELIKVKEEALSSLRQYIKDVDEDVIKIKNVYIERLRESSTVEAIFNNERPIYWTDDAHVYSDPPEKAYDLSKDKWIVNSLVPFWLDAKEQLILISPYFVPGEEGMKILKKLRSQDVGVGVVTNSLAATDVMVVHSGYAPYRIPLLEEGIKIYEFTPYQKVNKNLFGSSGASLHTKVFIVDHKTSFIGSFNFDPRSARLNTEMGVLFVHPALTKELIALYEYKVEKNNSYELFLEDGKLRWLDGTADPERIWKHDPEVGIFNRMILKVLSWLPIESQL
ncbi:phospholipase D family protein [Entomomonas asaccharolytica]|uniref:Phospholipase D family protein n=1 Tax=Entomomonas asaccharolytica TaxID=2785331 RepID=A0A974NF29_9GAMM|nr:phospholipase D family protein [Entomomonas asaccharolytica]QQP85247.1 phospholipase D family protein [Entomomonas asaccharolytica]